MVELSTRIADLSPEKLRRLTRRLGKKTDAPVLPALKPSPSERYSPFPMTDVQQAYWLGRSDLFALGNVSAHGYSEVEAPTLDIGRFESALQRVIERHDMLRMIVLSDGRQQVLERVEPYHIVVQDLRGISPEEVERRIHTLRHRMSHQVLPSDRWPLFEICASRLEGERVRLHIGFDILIADLWSYQLLMRDLGRFYAEPDLRLPPLEITFRDYILTVESMRETDVYRRSLEYWHQRLPTLPAAPELPLAVAPESLEQPRFVRRSKRLDADAWLRLRTIGSQEGLTPSGILLAAYAEVLALWSKSQQFTLNLTLFNRLPLHQQVNEVVGDFTALTLLAVDGRGEGIFLERAKACQEQLWRDLEHSHIGGVRLLRELGKLRGRQVMPVVFTSALTHNTLESQPSEAGLFGEIVYSISQTPQVWLDHQVSEREGVLFLVWDAVEELFPAGLLDDMFAAYGGLLERLAAGEGWREEVRGLLPGWQAELRQRVNATGSPVSEQMLHGLFAAQARRSPGAPAVLSGRRRLSYGELERRSLALGRRLRELGAAPNRLVAVVMEKGWEQVVAVVGILESGAAYLPIEPSLPRQRRWHLLERGEVEVVVTQPWLESRLEWPQGVRRVVVEEAEPEVVERTAPVQGIEDLAYVIFTSGSTGEPKGVMIDHRGAVNTVLDVNERFGVGSADRVLALSSLGFDLSVYDIFGLLAAGGAVVLPEPEASRDPVRWAELLGDYGVTVWNTVPALLEMLLEHGTGDPLRLGGAPRLVLLSGDWIGLSLPERVWRVWPQARLISLGGATEASIWSILYPIGKVEAGWRSIPYGRPMVNQSFHVLDGGLKPRPVWVPGELYIGGLGVALGYWGDAARTAASFVRHPVSGERLYRTGDLGRYLADGTIEFLGREDTQVKVQGHRIELGEIESALESYPWVRSAVVLAVGEGASGRRLVAYVVAAAGEPVAGAAAGVEAELERLEHKLSEPGLRRFSADRPAVSLARQQEEEGWQEPYRRRRTHRRFGREALAVERFGEFLAALRQARMDGAALPRYRYPSAGTLYPVQVYVYVAAGRVEGLEAGTYYYDPKEHRLVSLRPGARLDRSVHGPVNRRAFDESAFSLFLVGSRSVIEPVYGELWRDFCLLEAGYMSQLLMETAAGHGLGICPIGSLDFGPVGELLELEEGEHEPLHALLGGLLRAAEAAGGDAATAYDPVAELRSYLRERLPDYMVPTAFLRLETLPLTHNGKIDRAALLRSSHVTALPETAYEPPRSAVEKDVARVVREVLGVEKIGLRDNFFDLGGNSVHLVKLHRRLQETFGCAVSMVQMFNHPTVSAMATLFVPEGSSEPSPREERRDSALQQGRDWLKSRSQQSPSEPRGDS